MDTTVSRIAELLNEAPLRTTTGIGATHEALRHWATLELAEYLAEGLAHPPQVRDAAQMKLPL